MAVSVGQPSLMEHSIVRRENGKPVYTRGKSVCIVIGWLPLWKSAVTSLVCRVRALILRNWAVSYFVGVFVAVGTGCVPTAAN